MGGIKVEKIKIKNLIFSYPNSEKTALNDINLTINQGEFVTICGKSGCGKSTLLRHLKPILTPHGKTSGEIYFDGKSIYDLSDREQAENIGFVMQKILIIKLLRIRFGTNLYSDWKVWVLIQLKFDRKLEMASFFGIQNWFTKM